MSPLVLRLLKVVTLSLLAAFLLSRYFGGTLLFYISDRFVWLTLTAGVGFVLVALSYLLPESAHSHDGHDHTHDLSALGLMLILLPVILGVLVPPRPLGAAAMANREINTGLSRTSASPKAIVRRLETGSREKNLLDWLLAFEQAPDLNTFAGQEARLVGFVYKDARYENSDRFLLSRFTVSCCVADASAVGITVRWPEAAALPKDEWVDVSGRFEIGDVDGKPAPVLVADKLEVTEPPSQPYLYLY